MPLRSFAELPALVEELMGGHERVVLVYFDAFAWRFAERHAGHPLLREAEVERWASQFPSTTAVHTTTIHTGLPVGEHGIYEWHVYEPRLDRLVTPLWHCFAGDPERDTLFRAGLEGADLFPFETLYERWEWPSHVAQPAAYAFSPASRCLLRGATVHPFRPVSEGLGLLARALAAEERGYATIHLPELDTHMHLAGPDSPDVDRIVGATLDAIRAAPWPSGTAVLVTSDHGMAAISPERTSYVNVVWPELPEHLVHGADGKPLAPAGSARDLFLHVLPDRLDEVAARLGTLLEGKADVRRVDELVAEGLFGEVGERLRARLANLVVLPHPGEAAYWLEPGRFEQRFLGQHGGLWPDEAEIPLVRWLAP
ncbi:MAG TPA: alkaline phosphatase family protein [Gaiellaceae bacterium]|nr:alkaline phosphatase family protein [Gaiellaceae bacterium]